MARGGVGTGGEAVAAVAVAGTGHHGQLPHGGAQRGSGGVRYGRCLAGAGEGVPAVGGEERGPEGSLSWGGHPVMGGSLRELGGRGGCL